MDAKSNAEDGFAQTQISRRAFARGVGTAGAVAVVGTAGVGSAAATAGVDWDHELAPETTLRATVTVDQDIEDGLDDLDYLDEDGLTQSLASDAMRVAPRVDDETPHNPVTVDVGDVTRDEDEDDPIAEREIWDEDDEEIVIEEIFETAAEPISITSLSTLDVDVLDEEETLVGIEVDVEQRARDLDSDLGFTEELEVPDDEVDDTVSGRSTRLRAVANHKLVDDPEVAWESEELVVGGVHPSGASRYEVAGYSPDESSPSTRTEDALDLALVDVVDDLEAAADAEETEISLDVSEEHTAGEWLVSVIDIGLTSSEVDELLSGADGFFGGAGATGGSDGFLSGVRGWILGLAGLAGAAIAAARSRTGV